MKKIIEAYSSVVVSDLSNDLIQSVDVMYYLSTSSASLSGGSWETTPPILENGKYYWQKTVTTFKDNSTSETEAVCITGAKGSTGKGVVSITEEYYLSTSKESPTDGSWNTDAPAWENGKYIWTRSKIVYSNPTSTEYTTPCCDSSWEAANNVKDELEEQIKEVRSTVAGVSSKVDSVEKSITNKVWQTDITTSINTYDGTTGKEIRDRITVSEQDIKGLKTSVSDVQSAVADKADGSTVTSLSEKVSTMEQDSESFKVNVQNNYVTNASLANSLNNYSTTTQMNSAIEAKADEINLSVSSTYATKNSLSTLETNLQLKDSQIEGKVTDNAGNIATLTTNLNGITQRVTDAEGNIGTLQATTTGISAELNDARGNSSSLHVRLNSIESTVKSKNQTFEGKGSPNYTGSVVKPLFTDLIQTATSEAGEAEIYNGVGYKDNYRWSSSGGKEQTYDNARITGWIPYVSNATYRIKNMGMSYLLARSGYSNGIYFITYKSGTVTTYIISRSANDNTIIDNANELVTFTPTYDCDYFRLSGYSKDSNLENLEAPIVTCNEEIVYGDASAMGNPNSPSVTWKAEGTEVDHLGDLYIDTETGYLYRWQLSGDEYKWVRVKDSDITSAESSIAQNARNIELRVKEESLTGDYVISKINLESTTATIEAKRINLKGAVTISSLSTEVTDQLNSISSTASTALSSANASAATISSWCSKNNSTLIDGSKIYTGSISADKIDVNDLFSQNITATNLHITGNSTFNGSGTFNGHIEAETGQIGCFTIENASLVANVDEGFSAILLQSHTEETADYHNLYLSPKQLQIYSIYSSNSTADRVDKIAFLSGDGLIFNGTGECSKYTYTDCSIAGNLTVKGTNVSLDGHTHATLNDCNFTDSLTLKGVNVSVDGHIHNVLTNSDGTGKVSLVKDGSYYFLRPHAASKVASGSSTYPWYNTYTERLNVTVGRVTCLPTYENTTTYATNMYVGTSGIFSRTTNTSSKTIKHDIRELQSADIAAERLYDVDVFQFKYNEDIITDKNDARYMKDLPGFIIEDLYEKYPIAVDKPSENVKDWSWNAQYLIPPMVKLLQEQRQADVRLESDINTLKSQYEQALFMIEQLYTKLAEQQKIIERLAT